MSRFDVGTVLPARIPQLTSDSWFENPVVIHANLAPNNSIKVGAFSGVYGGKVGHCRIGRFCSIAPGVDIASDQHPMDWLSSSMMQYVPNIHGWGDWLKSKGYKYKTPAKGFDSNSPVTIGNDVWIGQGVFIKSGVTIGDGCVIAAHSVVVKDLPPYSICAGVPCRVIKPRFSEDIIERLIAIKWWNYNILGLEDIDFSNIEGALEKIELSKANGELELLSLTKNQFNEDTES